MSATNEIAPLDARTGVAARAVGLTKTYGADMTVMDLDRASGERALAADGGRSA